MKISQSLKDKIRHLLNEKDNDEIYDLVNTLSTEENAMIFGHMPLSRANQILSDYPHLSIDDSLDFFKSIEPSIDGEVLTKEPIALEHVPRVSTKDGSPLCVKAIDKIGKLFGRWTDQPTRTHENSDI